MGKVMHLAADDLIISKTDTEGRIIYCNRAFMRLSGYSSADALGQPHRLVRHPDMPRGIFKLLWQTVQNGEEFHGFIKNRTRDGDAYWCFSSITPNYTAEGRLNGYFAVQRQARREALEQIEEIYRQMQGIERRSGHREAPAASLRWLREHLADQGSQYEPFIILLQRGVEI